MVPGLGVDLDGVAARPSDADIIDQNVQPAPRLDGALDDRAATAALLAHAVDVQDDVIPVREGALDLAMGVGKFFPQEAQKPLETFDAVRRGRIVLNIAWTEIFRRRLEILLVQRLFIEL